MGFFDTAVEFLKGVGPQRSALLQQELKIATFGELLQHYPFRYEDRTTFYMVKEVHEDMPYVQVRGTLTRMGLAGTGFKKRLVGTLADNTGTLELVWFQGIAWTQDKIKPGREYVVFGKPQRYGKKISIAHPEIEPVGTERVSAGFLQPVYPITEKLRARHVDSKFIWHLQLELLKSAGAHIRETLPDAIRVTHHLLPKKEAVVNIHFPKSHELLAAAQRRLKWEELFYVQLRLLKLKLVRQDKYKGQVLGDTSRMTAFYNEQLPFPRQKPRKK